MMEKKSIFKKALEYIFSKKGSIFCLVFGCIALFSNFLLPNKDYNIFLNCVAGLLGCVYAGYPCYLYCRKIVEFDWQLINGHFLQKVCCLALFLPFTLWFVSLILCSPKALVYEDNLYHEISEEITDTIHVNDSLFRVRAEVDQTLPDSILAKQADPSFFWGVYYHFIDPGNQHMTTTLGGRVIAAIISIFGMFLLNGLLVSSIIGWIDRRKEKWLKGEIKYDKFLSKHGHYIIIGGNDMVAGIVRQLFCPNNKAELVTGLPYVLIQTNRDVENFRRELFSDLTEDEQKRVIIYYGSRTSADDVAALILENAKEVYILGEDTRTDDIESYHDTMNMECLKRIYEYLSEREPYHTRIKELNDLESQMHSLRIALKQTQDEKLCANMENTMKDLKALYIAKEKEAVSRAVIYRVMFEYQTTFSVYQFSEISKDIKSCIQFKPFNYYEMWAQRVLISKEFKKSLKDFTSYIPLEGVGINRESDNFVHLIIVGMSRAGVALAVEAAHLAHYPNFETKKKRTRITFIDMNMEAEMNFFKGRFQSLFSVARHRFVFEMTESIYSDVKKYPWMNPLKYSLCNSAYLGDYLGDDFIDIEWEFINGSIEHPNVQQYLEDASNNSDAKITIASCLPEDNKALAVALYLPRTIYLKDNVQQILVYQRYASSTINMVSNKRFSSAYNNKLKSFGMVSDGYDVSLVNDAELIADLVSKRYENLQGDIDNYTNGLVKRNINAAAYKIAENIKDKLLEHFELDSGYIKKNDLKVQKIVEYCNDYCEENGVSKIDKVEVAKWWSDIYNANILWTKLRCIDFIDDGTVNELSDNDIWDLANVEHNRWNMEQLLMTYSPLTKEEMFDVLHYTDKPLRNIYKGVMKHSDLCSCTQLKVYSSTFKYDVAFARDLVDNYYKVKENNKRT